MATKLEEFYIDISQAAIDAKDIFENLDDTANVYETINMLDTSRNQYLEIWPDYSSNDVSMDVKTHFKNWCKDYNSIGSGSGIEWSDLSGNNDNEIWDGAKLEGKIFDSNGDITDASLNSITEKQYNSMIYEMIYLSNKYDNDSLTRQTNKTAIKGNYPLFDRGLPSTLVNEPKILEIKRNTVIFYVMTKNDYNQSDVNTGLIFENNNGLIPTTDDTATGSYTPMTPELVDSTYQNLAAQLFTMSSSTNGVWNNHHSSLRLWASNTYDTATGTLTYDLNALSGTTKWTYVEFRRAGSGASSIDEFGLHGLSGVAEAIDGLTSLTVVFTAPGFSLVTVRVTDQETRHGESLYIKNTTSNSYGTSTDMKNYDVTVHGGAPTGD